MQSGFEHFSQSPAERLLDGCEKGRLTRPHPISSLLSEE
jgi:hypothetical protein